MSRRTLLGSAQFRMAPGTALVLLLASGCAERFTEPGPAEPAPGAGNAAAASPDPGGDASVSAEPAAATAEDCAERVKAALAEPALPGAPGFEARRGEILARSKAEPVLFRRAPVSEGAESAEVASLRALLRASPSPAWTLHGSYRHLRNRPELARALLLPQGYLYSESPDLAAAFVDFVELHHLFTEPKLVIQRGSELLHARKSAGFWYEYTDGPERGQRARILLLDRVWPAGQEPGPPLHLDLRRLALQAGFERLRVRQIGETRVVADLRHGSDWVPALLRIDGTRLSLECEAVPAERAAAVEAARELVRRRQSVLEPMRAAMVAMVTEALPFDEPRTEEGQQDGNLRPAWRWAYTHGWDSYTFNEDTYLVFDALGRPKVPQVCIDFVTDTLERASGTWWAVRDQERARISGALDFDGIGIDNRRSVDVFIRFAQERPEWFDVVSLDEQERIRFFDRRPFFEHLREHADRYLPGDVVAIHGPRSDGENHWHSFFVYDSDPVTGMPTLLAANAGKPRIRSWEGEMRAAPRRSIHTRIRPRLEWLEGALRRSQGVSAQAPAPLISAPI